MISKGKRKSVLNVRAPKTSACPDDESLIKVNELPEPWTNLCDAHCQEG